MTTAEDVLVGYFRLMSFNGAAHVYRCAEEAGLLRELQTGRKHVDELAAACGLKARPTRLLLDAVAATGVVTATGDDGYALSPLGQMLAGGSYRNLGDEYWSHLPKFLASNTPIMKMDDRELSEAHYQSQAAILGWMLTPAAECAANLLSNELPADAAIVDVGAGSAIWSLKLASQMEAATVIASDWPAVLEVALETARQHGLQHRFKTIAGNYHDIALPTSQFDVAILANVTHLETPDGNRHLFTKILQTLKPQGRVVIIDVFAGQPAGDLNRTLYTLGLALRTKEGQVYTAAELDQMLGGCGFRPAKLLPLPVPPYIMGMLVAERAIAERT
jgi:SAM-dependent methyltransferase